MKEKIMQVFKSIGLAKNEIKVYLDLVQYGLSSALEISRRIGIHRPNTYDALRGLIEKGFITETVKENRKCFVAVNPERITEYVMQKKHDVEEVIPYLKDFTKKIEGDEEVYITKGVYAFRNALISLLELNKPINISGIPIGSHDVLGDGFLADFHDRRIKKKILMRHIYNREATDRVKELNKLPYTEAKHLARKYDADVSINICGNVVLMVIFSNPISIIEIKNKEIAATYNKYFEILWKHAKSA
ncbi:TrmB family transcriptional regulator [Candidatus Pacearchaeota archaeon]|nr:TrmB family transcriptional regulator [Candidatus Pacearchaeota archaeon]